MGADAETYSQTSRGAWGTLQKRGKDGLEVPEGSRTPEPQPTETAKQGSYVLTEPELAIVEIAWVCTRSSAHMLWLFSLGVLVGLLAVGEGLSLTFLPA